MTGPWRTTSPEETRRAGAALAAAFGGEAIVLLEGDLAAGKTVLTQGIAEGLGIDPREVQSPTFTLAREHRGPGGRLVHLDLYRLEPGEVEELGLDDILGGEGMKVVEWAERLPREVPGARRVRVETLADGSRRIAVIG